MVEVTACPVCGADVANEVGRRGRSRIYCSQRCNRQAVLNRASVKKQAERQSLAKPCETCEASILPAIRGPVPRYCSDRCREVGYGSVLAEPYAPRKCELAGCGVLFTPKSKTQRCCSEAHGKKHSTAKAKAAGRPYSKGSSEARRAGLRRKTQLRRARLLGAKVERVDRDVIGDRDNWMCGICGLDVDRSVAWPDPGSPSLDHVVPLSRGGDHTAANIQIAHLYCNNVKGARPIDEVA